MKASDTTVHPLEACLQRAFADVEQYVRREPAKAVAGALTAGLLLKILPTRAISRPLTAAGVALLPSALVGLGLIKAFELCMQQGSQTAAATPSSPTAGL